jgi:hypothetical protein
MPNPIYKSDAIGLVVLATEIALLIPVFTPAEIPILIWILVYLVLGITAVYLWHSEKSPRTPVGWLGYAAGSFVLGGLFFAADVWVGRSGHPNLPLLDAATRAGGPFGFVSTLFVCPALTFISVAGVARATT